MSSIEKKGHQVTKTQRKNIPLILCDFVSLWPKFLEASTHLLNKDQTPRYPRAPSPFGMFGLFGNLERLRFNTLFYAHIRSSAIPPSSCPQPGPNLRTKGTATV